MLRILHEKLKGRFKSRKPLPPNLEQLCVTEDEIDDQFSHLISSTVRMIGGTNCERFLIQMQRAYDKQLVHRTKLKSEESEQSEGGIKRRRKSKADRKTLRLRTNWSESQIKDLLTALEEYGTDWRSVAARLKNRSLRSVRRQVKSMIKAAEEDPKLQGAGVLLCLSLKSPSWSKEEKS